LEGENIPRDGKPVQGQNFNLTCALAYARAGLKIIPCYYDPATGKKPPIHHKDFAARASDDAKVVTDWFTREWRMPGVVVEPEHVLIGLLTGPVNDLIVIDIDKKPGGADGHVMIPGWEHLAQVIAETPSGGHHLYYHHSAALRLKNEAGEVRHNGRAVKVPGVDVRAHGGYVIAPGSTLPTGRHYRWYSALGMVTERGEAFSLLTDVPTGEITELARRQREGDRKKSRRAPISTQEELEDDKTKALRFVARMAQEVAEAVSGTRDETLKGKLHACGSTVHAGLLTEAELVAHFWPAVQACGLDRDGVNQHVLEKKVRDALDSSRSTLLPRDLQPNRWADELNERYFVLTEYGGKFRIGRFKWNPVLKRFEFRTQAKDDFLSAHMNVKVRVTRGDETFWEPRGKAWLEHRDRREFEDVVLMPDEPPLARIGDDLNIWRGFAVEPRAGSWSRTRRHLFEVIAQRDREVFRYVVRWMAWAVQHPGEPCEAELVLVGRQGTGKGIVFRPFVRLFGQHGMQTANMDAVVDKFNEHLIDCCLVYLDEASAPRDPKAADRIKAMVTEDTLDYHPKFGRRFTGKNHLKFVSTTNRAHAVHAEEDDRRNAVFRVSEARVGDAAYFKALDAELSGDGLAAMLHFLLNLDLGDFHPRQIPNSEAREEQKELSRNVVTDALLDALEGDPCRFTWADAQEYVTQALRVRTWSNQYKNLLSEALEQLRWVGYRPAGLGDRTKWFAHTPGAHKLKAKEVRDLPVADASQLRARVDARRNARESQGDRDMGQKTRDANDTADVVEDLYPDG
jgi:hypothetical protein